jgi:hypothetical protein
VANDGAPLPPRLRRVLDLVYGVEGVTEARVWQWAGGMAVGVRAGVAVVPGELLKHVELAVSALREPGEKWEFGLLDSAPDGAH